MRKTSIAMLSTALLAPGAFAETEDAWSFEMFLGAAQSFPMPLTIRQEGYADINLTAEYETRPFEEPPYCAWRVGRWKEGRAWELEFVHHKLYLRNEPPDVQHFEITHGYNLITVNRAWSYAGFVFRFGAGVVVSHPESIIRDQELPEDEGFLGLGFYRSGSTAQGTAGKKFYLKKGLFWTLEAKLTVSYAWVPVVEGDADAPVIALHGLFGLGYEF